MSGTVKGIIVEIGGNTSGLQKALSKVNSATASLTKELRGVNSLLKLDPKNTELLSQKQQILSKDIEDTENKLKILHSTYQRGVEAEANGSKISEENWRNLQREIINTENKLKSLKLEASNWTQAGKKLEEFGGKIDNLGGRIENLGNKLTKTFTVSIVGAGVASIKSAMDFETAFTGVEKTVDGTDEQIANLKQGIKDLATEIPSSTTEISAVAEAAGQLGIQTDNVLNFTKTMIDMGNATNLSADEAATTLARFANITKMKQSDFNKLGSVIVALGNNFATTESEIADMGMNLASAGTQVGMSQSQIMALATALSSVGLEAQAGGTAFSKVMVNMQLAVEKGGNQLKNFASVAGMSTKEFKRAFKEDATTAIMKFVEGLSKSGERGKSAIKVLDDMGITETRLRDSLLRSANASSIFSKAIEIGNQEWNENTALANEANKRYATLESRFKKTMNKANNLTTSLGNKLTPTIGVVLDKVDNFMDKLNGLTDEETENIVKTGLMVASIGPLVKIIGKITSTTGNAIKGVGLFSQAIGAMRAGTATGVVQVDNLAKMLSLLSSPLGVATLGVGALTAATIAHAVKTQNEIVSLEGLKKEVDNQQQSWKNLQESRKESLTNSMAEIDYIQKLADELKQITDENGRVKTSYENRASYIVNELNSALGTEYKINNGIIEQYSELKDGIQDVIAKKKAEAYLNAYQKEYEEAVKSSSDAVNNYIDLMKKYDETMKTYQSSSGKAKIEADQKLKTIKQELQDQYSMIDSYGQTISNYENLVSASANGSAEQLEQAMQRMGKGYDDASKSCEESLASQIEQYTNYNSRIEKLSSEAALNNKQYLSNMLSDDQQANEEKLNATIKTLQSQTSAIQGMTDDQKQAWKNLAESDKLAYAKALEGLDGNTRLEVQKATNVFVQDTSLEIAAKNLAIKTKKEYNNNTIGKKDGEDAVTNLSNGLTSNKSRISLSNAASGLGQLIRDFLGHSVPKKGPLKNELTYMPDMIKNLTSGIDKNKSTLLNSVMKMSNEMKEKLNIANLQELGDFQENLSSKVIDNTKMVFTTPQITFNVQELDKEKLEQCFNYINRKFGSLY